MFDYYIENITTFVTECVLCNKIIPLRTFNLLKLMVHAENSTELNQMRNRVFFALTKRLN